MVLLRDQPNLFWMENDKGSIVDKILVRPAKYTVKKNSGPITEAQSPRTLNTVGYTINTNPVP